MKNRLTSLALLIWLLPTIATAALPAKGRLLVATEQVRGEVFARTVILLLHYDANGAMGIVVNRPTDVALEEVVDDIGVFGAYDDTLFWGGPVQMGSLRALLRTDSPPPGAETIIESVHLVDIDDRLKELQPAAANLRYYIGYAGWAAGQLDSELARGSWDVVSGSDEHVFAQNPTTLWESLTRPARHVTDKGVGFMPEARRFVNAGQLCIGYLRDATSM